MSLNAGNEVCIKCLLQLGLQPWTFNGFSFLILNRKTYAFTYMGNCVIISYNKYHDHICII